ncbi:ribosomal RNA large subunit methyltransferase J [Necator americanus]|nr:ribosomal RNA large subunit methyltransferase J [Necator americanus]ETN86164.1 ribosomal RNA large subunit methyltransferase J [Necator americanus]
MSVLTKAKHEDLKETFEEEYDHYKGKRRCTDDSADGDLSDSSTDDLDSPPPAKIVAVSEEVDRTKPMTNAEKMMAKMGYKEGKGLGKQKQGMVEPVALSTQRGRVGLGHEISKAVGRDFTETWDETKEDKSIEEYVVWLTACPESTRDWVVDNLEGSEWIQIGEKKTTLDDETEFCDGEILRTMIKSKEVFNVIPDRDLREARARANPYETIGGAFFQNRAAMKVANMDKVFDWLLSMETEDKLLNKNPLKSDRPTNNCDRETPLFYFADVCAGPGGFSEYMLWRKAFYNAKGFGFTLKGKDDFKLGKFTASSAYYFEPYYGKHGDGDVMNPENIDSLEDFIMKGTNDMGVDLMMADGGFSVEGQETIQEILSKRLYLCQLLVSLCIVKEGGVFFCKLFDIFTPFSAGLIYLMYIAYDQVTLHKPHTSRPANSERYIVCKGLRKNYSDAIRDYLKRVNIQLDEFAKSKSSRDVISVVPVETMRNDETFTTYLTEHNERLAIRQSTYLQKYLSYARNSSLIDKDQATLRDDCLKYWLVPNKTLDRRERGAERQQIDPDQYFGRFTRKFYGREDFNARLPPFTANLLTERMIKELKYAEYSLNILSNRASTQPELLISTGDAVFVWKKHWERLENNLMRIPDRTVLLVERATTYKLVDKHLDTVAANGLVRILDAAVINGDDVSGLLYSKRMEAAKKFCQALKLVVPQVRLGWGQHERYIVPPQLVTAELFQFDQLAEVRRRFSRLRHSGEEILVFEENGHLLMCKAFRVARLLKESWKMGWSCSRHMTYAFCPQRADLGSFFEPQWEE